MTAAEEAAYKTAIIKALDYLSAYHLQMLGVMIRQMSKGRGCNELFDRVPYAADKASGKR